jgi:hypothetical protein
MGHALLAVRAIGGQARGIGSGQRPAQRGHVAMAENRPDAGENGTRASPSAPGTKTSCAASQRTRACAAVSRMAPARGCAPLATW